MKEHKKSKKASTIVSSVAMSNKEVSQPIKSPNIVWENPSITEIPEEIVKEIKHANAILNSQHMIVHTPLRRLEKISKQMKKEVYIKEDALQDSGSFKMRGVSYEIFLAVDSYISRIKNQKNPSTKDSHFYIVTQTDGNHGIAMIQATGFILKSYLQSHPDLAPYIKNIEPIVFTIRNLPEIKEHILIKSLLI